MLLWPLNGEAVKHRYIVPHSAYPRAWEKRGKNRPEVGWEGVKVYKTNLDGAVRAGYIELIGAVCGLMWRLMLCFVDSAVRAGYIRREVWPDDRGQLQESGGGGWAAVHVGDPRHSGNGKFQQNV